MIVPQFWAEGKIRDRIRDHQVTVRRFGWSDISQADAQQHANSRVRDAFDRLRSGETIGKTEPKVPYNGADGVPIREEILSRHGELIVTRNIYGARCLNTPDVLFADVDSGEPFPWRLMCVLWGLVTVLGVSAGLALRSKEWVVIGLVCAIPLASFLAAVWRRTYILINGGLERLTRRRIESFIEVHPDWHLRLYRTPAGFRLLALHQTFQPRSPVVSEFFAAVSADPVYVRMCIAQNCFRARVSPKPWRIGIESHLKPRPGVWPINPERLPDRISWVTAYEQAAQRYAACRLISELGNSTIDPTAHSAMILHDALCQATDTSLPLA